MLLYEWRAKEKGDSSTVTNTEDSNQQLALCLLEDKLVIQ
jgi:hypothetical protein